MAVNAKYIKSYIALAILALLSGCETFSQVEGQILTNASNACNTAETNTP